ncbi:tagaturonate reductase, partial [Polaribacter sp. BAL334]|nr:tagaturonate reductase [Polaribacter sp. BAL334]
FNTIWNTNDSKFVAEAVLSNVSFWDEDLTKVPHLKDSISLALHEIEVNGIEKGLANFSKKY